MKINDLLQIKELDVKSLKQKTIDLKKEIGELILDKNMNKLNDLKSLTHKRRDLAQVATILRQKELLAELEGKVTKSAHAETPLPKKGDSK